MPSNRNYKTGILITGDAKGGVKAVELTQDALRDLNKTGKKVAREQKSAFDELKDTLFSLKGAFAGVIAVGLVWTREILQATKEIDALSAALNVNANDLRAWQAGAQSVGLSAEKMGDIFKDTSDKIGDFAATGGGEAKDVFEQLGLSIKDVIDLSPDKQLLAIAKGLEQVGSQSEKVFLLESLADESSRLLPLLEDNAAGLKEMTRNLDEFGVTLSAVEAAALKEANREIGQLSLAMQGLKTETANLFAPLISTVTPWLRETLVLVSQLIGSMAEFMRTLTAGGDGAQAISEFWKGIAFTFHRIGLELVDLGSLFVSLKDLAVDSVDGIGAAWDKFTAAREDSRVFVDEASAAFVANLHEVTPAVEENIEVFKRYNRTLGEHKEELSELDKLRKRTLDQGKDYLKGLLGQIEGYQESNAALKEYQTQLQITHLQEQAALETNHEYKQAYLDLADAIRSSADEVTRLQGLAASSEAAEKAAKEAAKAFQDSARVIEQSLTDSLMRAFEGGADFAEAFVSGIEDLFRTMILRPTIQATVAPIANSIVGALGGGPGGGGGIDVFSLLGSGVSALSGGGGFLGTFGAGIQAGAGALGAGGIGGAFNLSSGLLGAGHTAMGIGAALPFALPILGIGAALLGGLFKDEPDPRFSIGGDIGNVGVTGTQDIDDEARQVVDQLVATIDAFEDQFLALLNDAERQAIAEAGGLDLGMVHIESEHELTAAIVRRMKSSLFAIDDNLGGLMHDAIQEIRQTRPHDLTLADADQLVQDVLMPYLVVREVMDRIGQDLGGDLAGASQNIVAAAGGLEAYQQGVASYFNAFYTQAEKFEAFSADLSESLSSLGIDAIPASRAEFRALVEAIDLTTVAGQELHGALIAVAPAVADFYTETERLADQLAGLMQGVDEELAGFGLSAFQQELRNIARWMQDTTEQAREYGASQAELSRIQQVAALRTREAIASLQTQISGLVSQLYGGVDDTSGIDSLIQQEQTRLTELNTLARDLYNQERARYQLAARSADQIDDFLANLAVGSLSPLTPLQQYQSARGEYDATLAAAQSGDPTALGDITGRFNNLLNTSQFYNASSQAYVTDYERGRADLLALAEQLGAITEPSAPEDLTTSQIIQALEAQRQLAEQQREQADRQALALELVRGLSDMGIALDRSVIDLARENGVNLRQLATDVGLNLTQLDRTLALQLIEAANITGEHLYTVADVLGVDLERLAVNVGVDISRMTGDLSTDLAMIAGTLGIDVQWLAGAFGQRIDGLGDQFQSDIQALLQAIDALPPDQRDALAPYLNTLANVTASTGRDMVGAIYNSLQSGGSEVIQILQAINGHMRSAGELLYGVRQNLRNIAGAVGASSYATGGIATGPSTGYPAMLHGTEAVVPLPDGKTIPVTVRGADNADLVRELRELRGTVAQLQQQISREHAQSVEQRGAIAHATLQQGEKLAGGLAPRTSAKAVA